MAREHIAAPPGCAVQRAPCGAVDDVVVAGPGAGRGRGAHRVPARELDGALALERERLEARREKLRSAPAENHGPIDDLKLPHNLEIAPQVPTQAAVDAPLA